MITTDHFFVATKIYQFFKPPYWTVASFFTEKKERQRLRQRHTFQFPAMNTLKFLVNAKNADLMVTNSILLVQKNIPFSWQLRLKDAFKRPFKSVKCANERRRESSRKPPRFLIEKRKTQASRFASRAKNIQQGRIFFTSYGFSSCMLLCTLTT